MHNNEQKQDLVTVVTVTYNAKDLLEETILSVINQSYKNIEYIVIDGSSTDNTVEIIKKYEDRISYWVSEPDEGIYYAMNKAIGKARGEWINFMNAGDTFADPDTVEYVMKHKDNNSELIYGDHIRENPYRVLKAQKKTNWYSSMPFCHQTLFTKANIMKSTMLDTRYKLAADHNFVIHMLEQDKQFQHLEHNLAIYADGGFSQNEPLIACVESLYILLHSKASEEEIEASWWFKLLKKNMSADKSSKIKQLEESLSAKSAKIKQLEESLSAKSAKIKQLEESLSAKSTKIKQLVESFADLSSIKFLFHPVEKIKRYKKLMKTYHQIKN